MPQRFIQPADRGVFVAIGSWAIAMGVLMLADPTSPQRVWGYPLWGVMLVIGGALTAAFAMRMASNRLRAWAATLMVVGCAGRGIGLILGIVQGTTHSVQSGLLGVGAYTMLGFLLYLVWHSRLPDPEGPHAGIGG